MSQIRATTISDLAGTGPATLTGQYAAKAWVNFNGTGTVAIRESGNVSSITDNGTGDYSVNFTTATVDVNISIAAGRSNQNVNTNCNTNVGYISAPTTGGFRVGQFENGALTDIAAQYFIVTR